MEHRATIWFVTNPREVTDAYGLPLPVGWAYACDCGSVATGFGSRYLVELSRKIHRRFDSFVYTWVGDAPDQLVKEALKRVGPGRVGYTWGGMGWHVTVGLDWPVSLRAIGSRRPFVRLDWGDVVTIVGTKPDVSILVYRYETGDTVA